MLGITAALVASSVLPASADTPTPVDPADVASLTIAPGDETVSAGDWVYTWATAYDANGVSLGDVTTQATIVDSVSGEQDATHPWNLRPTTLGVHIITYTYGATTASISLTVIPGSLHSVVIGGIPTKPVVAGSTVTLTAEGYDAWMHDLGDYTSQMSFRLENAASNEAATGNSIRPTVAGVRTIDASSQSSDYGSATLTVVHAASAGSYRFAPLDNPNYVGVKHPFVVQSVDHYGNTVGTVKARLKSSHSTDKVSGSYVTFVSAGARTVTATIGTKHLTARETAARDYALSTFSFEDVQAGQTPKVTLSLWPAHTRLQPTGTVRLTYVVGGKTTHIDTRVTRSSTYTVHVPRLTVAGSWKISVRYLGSSTYLPMNLANTLGSIDPDVQYETVNPADPSEIVLSHSGPSYAGPTQFSTFLADKYGNHISQVDDAVITASGGATVDGDIVTFPKAGKYTVHATEGGYSTSKSVTVVSTSSTTEIVLPTPITAGVPSTVQVYVSSLEDPALIPVGRVVLHYGTKTLSGIVEYTPGDGASATFSLPSLHSGSYVLYATYSGDGGLHASNSRHITVKVVAAG